MRSGVQQSMGSGGTSTGRVYRGQWFLGSFEIDSHQGDRCMNIPKASLLSDEYNILVLVHIVSSRSLSFQNL